MDSRRSKTLGAVSKIGDGNDGDGKSSESSILQPSLLLWLVHVWRNRLRLPVRWLHLDGNCACASSAPALSLPHLHLCL